MSDLNLLVRTNESVPIGPPGPLLPLSGGPASVDDVVLLVSEVGAGTIATGSISYSASFYMNKVIKPAKATKAAGTIKRITDPTQQLTSDPSAAGNFADGQAHVDVADTSKTYTQQGSGSDYQLTKVYYADVPADEANTAVVGTWADDGTGTPGVEYAPGFSDGGGDGGGDFTDGSGDEGDAPDGMGGNEGDGGGDGGGGGGE